MKKIGLLLCTALIGTSYSFGQGARNIKINEVLTHNTTSLQDEFGHKGAWIELANTSYSTYNVRGMYVTTDRRVLDKNLTAPQRMAMMSPISSGDSRTNMSARQHLVFFLNGTPAQGTLHLSAKAEAGKPLWIALYNGNGVDLIDSVSVPALYADQSYARIQDGSDEWVVKNADNVTPGIENYLSVGESKIAKIKRDDPYGIGLSVLSMGIVFFCLALLYAFFRILGVFMAHKQSLKKAKRVQPIKAAVKTGEKLAETGHKATVILKDGLQTGGIDKEIYIAVISMALKQYEDDVHDIESNIITIKPHQTYWNVHPEEPNIP
ncbi:MAG: OadG family protein [Prevotellaceae bacterium]|nr:OadG family protein [Prevotellaceae bacterium]